MTIGGYDGWMRKDVELLDWQTGLKRLAKDGLV